MNTADAFGGNTTAEADWLAGHRRAWVFERVLLISDQKTYLGVKQTFETNLFNLVHATTPADAIRRITNTDFEVVLCDVTPDFAAEMFYVAVERVKPYVARRLVFLVDMKTDTKVTAFLRSRRCVMVWKPFEMHVLLDAMENVVKKTTDRVKLSEVKGLKLRAA